MIDGVNPSDAAVYEALFSLAQSLSGHTDLDSLCRGLLSSLRRVLPFEYMGLVLHEAEGDLMRLYALSISSSEVEQGMAVPVEGSGVGLVFSTQQPLVIPNLREERRWPEMCGRNETPVGTLVMVPLSNGPRRLGVILVGAERVVEPSAVDLVFLGRVASECAVTVDAYLTHKQLLAERNRLQVLFDITTTLMSKLSPDELFPAISRELAKVMAHDVAGIGLLDKRTGLLRLYAQHSLNDAWRGINLTEAHPDGLPSGEALRTGEPVRILGLESARFPAPLHRRMIETGINAGCSIPLITRNGPLGTLEIGRFTAEPFSDDEVRLGVQVARQIAAALENSLAFRELAQLKDKLATEKLYLEDEIRLDQNMANMIGDSPAFQALLKSVQIVAPTDATVMILGETGTGKELIARAIHQMSPRASRSFVKVNCAAIPSTLLESELFGHEKGAFTGAITQKLGRFELADRGTLFLDEVGEIPLELQSKLLRAIQEQEFERLGSTRTTQVDIRLIAATNRDLKAMMDEGKFRSDLYYRLHVFPVHMPPLRDRRSDIPLLVRYFTQKFAQRMNRQIDSIPSAAIDALTAYAWPGNVRELQNLIERSVILTQGSVLNVALPEPAAAGSLARPVAGGLEPERDAILRALKEARGKVGGAHGAAARLGLRRTTLQSRMKKLGINRDYC